ncbi:ABC transporter substrate binding protein [Salinibacter altiplanensis]|uniref:ABC transporter substrate binding protein n=1 Tax=Salinibacter altiplanensis TaxID=1803181 RepID=UPI000C9F66B5|nr:ABC transporter substrate binding protein [Salinibacter altiplanensis]
MHTRSLSLLSVLAAFLAMGTMPTSTGPSPAASASADGPTHAGPNPGAGLVQQMFFLKKMRSDVKRIGLVWKRGAANQEKKIEQANRAVASIQGKLYVGYVEDASSVAEQFRLLTRKHDVQAIWVIENDGVVNASAPQKYLIKNTIKEGIPLLAPSQDWVSAGAPVAIMENNGSIQIMLNEQAAEATALDVPEKYQSNTKLVAAAN